MIAMMIIMILTNKEWCRFIANNVVQEPLSLKLPMCVCVCGGGVPEDQSHGRDLPPECSPWKRLGRWRGPLQRGLGCAVFSWIRSCPSANPTLSHLSPAPGPESLLAMGEWHEERGGAPRSLRPQILDRFCSEIPAPFTLVLAGRAKQSSPSGRGPRHLGGGLPWGLARCEMQSVPVNKPMFFKGH